MSDYISGGVSFAGLGSGTDFDSMITQLKTVESIPLKRQQLWKADWQKRYDAFDQLLTKITDLKKTLGGLDTIGELLSKTVSSSKSSVATATATGEAPEGNSKIDVSQLATNTILTNSKVFASKTAPVATGSESMQYFDYTYKGESRSVKIPKGTTLQGVVDQINKDAEVGNIKVKAALIKSGNGYVFQLQGGESGIDADLSISSTTSVPGFGPEKALLSKTKYGDPSTSLLGTDLAFTVDGVPYLIDSKSSKRLQSDQTFRSGMGGQSVEFGYDGKQYKYGQNNTQSLSGQSSSGQYGMGFFKETPSPSGGIQVLVDKPINFKYKDSSGNDAVYSYDPAGGVKNMDDVIADITTQTGGAVTAYGSNSGNGYTFALGDKDGYAIPLTGSRVSVDYIDASNNPQTYVYDPATVDLSDPTKVKNLDEIAKEINELSGGKIKASVSGNGSYGLDLKDENGKNLAPANDPISFDYSYLDADGNPQTFSYAYDPTSGTKTLEEIAAEINTQSGGKVKASLTGDAVNGYKLNLAGTGTNGETDSTGNPLGFKNAANLDAPENNIDSIIASINKGTSTTGLSASKVKQPDGSFKLELKGDNTKFSATGGSTTFTTADKTMSEVVDELNSLKGPDGKKLFEAKMVKWGDGSGYSLELKGTPPAEGDPEKVFTDIGAFNEVGGGGDWSKRAAQDAKFTMNDLPQEYTSSSNELKEVFPGLTVTLTDTGATNLTVTTDSKGLKEKIVKYVDSVNELMGQFQDLTKVDKDKEVNKLETNYDAKDGSGAASLYNSIYTAQKGSLLTGNYGVQMLSTQLKTTASGVGKGFEAKDSNGVGDVFASLAAIGIVMDADESSATFGKLKILERQDSKDISSGNMAIDSPYTSLDEALEKDPKAVAELLAGTGGVTDSADIHFENSLNGVTKAGNYDVKYTVNPDGTFGDVFIGGTKALPAENNQFTVLDSKSPANGITISITNTAPGEHSSKVRIKQGKISEMVDFLDYQTKNDPVSIENGNRGTLVVLKDNYKKIMAGIDVKIEREQNRVNNWERNMKAQFSRLDTLLGNYQNISTSNQAALATAITPS